MKAIVLLLLLGPVLQTLCAQGVADPLSIQGLDQISIAGARARAMGGSVVAAGSNAMSMFANPSVLSQIESPEIRLGGMITSRSYSQRQEWIPNRFYADLSLMFENLLGGIKDPEGAYNPVDRLHKPFDEISPNWEHNITHVRPSQLTVAMPFSVTDMPVAAGIGYTSLISVDHYYQNNNATLPTLGSYRPDPIPVVRTGDSLKMQWFQYVRERNGTIHGLTPAISFNPIEPLHVGISVMVLVGSSDDVERRVERGLLTFFYNTYRLDSVYARTTSTGTSSYSGALATLGFSYRQEYYSLGLSLRFSGTIKRDWHRTVVADTLTGSRTTTEDGTDKLHLPLCTTFGVALHPTEEWNIGADYDIRQYGGAEFTPHLGGARSPWLSSKVLRVGVEYNALAWLDVRAGAREETQVFAPVGAGIMTDPAAGSTYSGGVGLHFGHFSVDLTYEYSTLEYRDMWQSNINFNSVNCHTGLIEIGYRLEE